MAIETKQRSAGTAGNVLLVCQVAVFAVGAAAEAIPHYSCTAVMGDMPEQECLLAFEQAGHMQLCGKMANERDDICARKYSKLACQGAIRDHKERCEHNREAFRWRPGVIDDGDLASLGEAAKFGSNFRTAAVDGSPIEDHSYCHTWWTANVGSTESSQDAAANEYRDQGMTYKIEFTSAISGFGAGNDYIATYSYGCTTDATTNFGEVHRFCGCREMWCPIWGWEQNLGAPEGNRYNGYGRSRCYTSKQIFGCWKNVGGSWTLMPGCIHLHTLGISNLPATEQQLF